MAAWGEAFALSSALVWAFAVILLRRSGETLPPLELNLFKNVLGLVLVLPTIWIVIGFGLPVYAPDELAVVLLSGFLGIAVADTWYLKALNIMGAGRTGIVGALYTPFVILLSAVFLNESLTASQWAGFALVMAGILLVTWRRSRIEVDAQDVRRGALYAVGAMFMMAVGIVMVKEILEQRPFLWTLELRLFGGVAGMVLFVTLRRRWSAILASYRRPQPWGLITMAGFLSAYLALILWLAGYRLIPASVAAILNETNGSFIVLLAWLLLGEDMSRRKLAGLALTLVGVLIMLLV
jgi:drug/metabolite transporter (DMT)-like permease